MGTFDLHKELNTFYDEHVVLGAERRKKLAGYRDACLKRLTDGLALLGKERGRKYKTYLRSIGQGSYTMHTLNQHPNDEYDIDEAIIFAKEDLPSSALDARKLVADALLAAGGNFKTEPEARTNAVTVWYADGTHVDLAIYREIENLILPNTIEHAGADWGARPPKAVTEWFSQKVEDLSPGVLADVRAQQLRRIVRWVKAWAKPRPGWSLPGGMILTRLVVEIYNSKWSRDDVSLLLTLKALKQRLATNVDVTSPIDGTTSLTTKPAIKAEMTRLVEKLDAALDGLAILENDKCTREQALRAWGTFFNHEFWGGVIDAEGLSECTTKGVAAVELDVAYARNQNAAQPTPYKSVETPIPKGRWIRFALPAPWSSQPGTTVRWIVENTGDEARAANDMGHDKVASGSETWRQAAYKGVHAMTCEVLRGGAVIARGRRKVQVARW